MMFTLSVFALRKPLLTLALTGTVAACGGAAVEEKFDGDRISVLSFDSQLQVDPRLKDAEIPVLPAFRNSSWANPGGFPTHASYHLELDGLSEAFRTEAVAGNSRTTQIKAPPIIADKKVFALGADLMLAAMDAESGAILWTQSLLAQYTEPNTGLSRLFGREEKPADIRDGFGGGIAYGRGRVIATTGFGEIIALNGETGEILWRVQNTVPFSNAPTVRNGRIYVASQDSRLQAFNIETGEQIWEHLAVGEQATVIGATSAAVSEQVVIAGFNSGEIVALSPVNGSVAWSENLTSRGTQVTPLSKLNAIVGRPVIDRDRAFVTSHGGRTVAIDLRTGERIWTADVGSIETPWVMGEYILLISLEGELMALSREQGRVRWLSQLPSFVDEDDRDGRIRWAGPILAGEKIILVSSDGRLVTVNPANGEIGDYIDIKEPVNVAPVVADGTLYVLTDEGSLIARR